ncbi:phage tail tube protein [Sphingomonas faeni]|uniref:phage tail tube protein n=1 Tax=Sphingomonas faeni TaxID=185950 RepID=UPI003352ACFE
MGRARGQNAIMALGFETAYGTPPASGYTKLPFVSCNLGAEQGLIESDLLGQGRSPADPTYDVVTNDGDIVVPLDRIALGYWLRLLFGAPSSLPTATAFQHLFTSGAAVLPSASIEIGMPDRPSYSTHYGVRAGTLQITMQRSGLSSMTLGLIGKGETVPSLTSNVGTLATFGSIDRFAQASGSIMIDGAVVGEVTTAQVSYSNGLDKDETIRADGEINDVDAGMPSASVSLTTKFADLTLYNKATSKTPVSIKLNWGTGDSAFEITLARVFLPRPKRPITGPGGIMAEFRGIGAGVDGVSPLFNVRLANTQASYA